MVERADLKIDGFESTKGPFDLGQRLVGADRAFITQRFLGHAGADDVETVERRFVGDRLTLASKGEMIIGDGEGKVLGHLVTIKHGADLERDLSLAT